MSWALPRARSSDRRHVGACAQRLAMALQGSARPDPEIDTTWHVRGFHDARAVDLSVGAPRMRRGIFGSERREWMTVEIRGATWLPAGAILRPIARTVWEWRDGLPGESPDLELGQGCGLGYVLRPAIHFASHGERARATLEALPRWALVEITAEQARMRASAPPSTGLPGDALAELLAWYSARVAQP